MKWFGIFIGMVLATAACTTTEEIRRPGGDMEFLIACGAATGWDVCYSRANELCPTGYQTLFGVAGFNRKELRILCLAQSRSISN